MAAIGPSSEGSREAMYGRPTSVIDKVGFERFVRRRLRPARLSIEIDLCMSAYRATSREIDALAREAEAAGACCPTCFYGREYSELCDRHDRQAWHVMTLLEKRGAVDDWKRIRSLRFDHPKPTPRKP